MPLTVQLVSVAVPTLYSRRRRCAAELPLTVQLVSVVAPSLNRPPPLTDVAAGDRQSRDRRRDTSVDLEHPAQPAAADRHARRRARDRLRLARVAQLELGAGQGDRLRRLEHRSDRR